MTRSRGLRTQVTLCLLQLPEGCFKPYDPYAEYIKLSQLGLAKQRQERKAAARARSGNSGIDKTKRKEETISWTRK